jgi:hypothetical protein
MITNRQTIDKQQTTAGNKDKHHEKDKKTTILILRCSRCSHAQ